MDRVHHDARRILMPFRYNLGAMRTTVDLPEDLLRQAKAIAHDKEWTMSQAIAWLVRRGLGEPFDKPEISVNPVTGLPSVRIGRIITSEDVKQLEDEE